uniref:Uncharacterized protein n=1 Tax=Trypanosoma congolense (strain IL3000) TaxID=1068625 RepID=G0UXT2_TRYCI|nr:conserved hypothetical protein [Trypanosoma congolense IL3000]
MPYVPPSRQRPGAQPALEHSVMKSLRSPRLIPRSIPADFSLQIQLLGAEFCASLSAAMVRLQPLSIPPGVEASRGRHTDQCLSASLLDDLSAHYGSHTLQRASCHPLGPCYKGKKRRISRGHHEGRQQLWSLAKAHRLWCRHCGLHLVPGITKVLHSSTNPKIKSLEGDDSACDGRRSTTQLGSTRGKLSVARGVYVCRRCLAKSTLLCMKKDCALFEVSEEERVVGKEQQENSQCTPSDRLANVLMGATVGRTRRRKRKGRGKKVEVKSQLVGNTHTSTAAGLHRVPKGSLMRGKRNRTVTPHGNGPSGDTAPNETGLADVRACDEGQMRSRKVPRGEGNSAIAQVSHAHVGADPLTHTALVAKQTAGYGGKRLPSLKGRGSAPKKGGGISSVTPKGSFADIMSRLGL